MSCMSNSVLSGDPDLAIVELVLGPEAAGALISGDYAAAIDAVLRATTAAVDLSRAR